MFASALFHASMACCLVDSGTSPSSNINNKLGRFSMATATKTATATATSVRIVVVGDVHDDWNLQEDTKALEFLRPDLVLFTGDFGNENVELVKSIADLKLAKAVILGNHDAWGTQKFSEKGTDAVQLQLESLGEEHVGYRRLDFPLLKVSVVGGRPFSCGGERIFRKALLSTRYGVRNMKGSAKKIFEAAVGTPDDHSVILLAHNGPTGLGSKLNDICGKDWVPEGGDHGDPDLEQAITWLKDDSTYSIPLVVFGHMHKELQYGNIPRKMIVIGDNGTIYLNGAIVPRVKSFWDEKGSPGSSSTGNEAPTLKPKSKGTLRAFTLVETTEGRLDRIAETWVSVIGTRTSLEEEHVLFSKGPKTSNLSP